MSFKIARAAQRMWGQHKCDGITTNLEPSGIKPANESMHVLCRILRKFYLIVLTFHEWTIEGFVKKLKNDMSREFGGKSF